MNIGLVIEHFDPDRGGAEHWTFQHAQKLVARGHEVHVITESMGEAVSGLPVTAHLLGKQSSRLTRAMAAEQALKQLPLDVIHDIGLGWHSDILQSEDGSRFSQWEHMLRALPALSRPLKKGLIKVLPRYKEFRQLVASQFSDPDRLIIAVANMCAQDYEQYHNVSPDRIRVIYHGTDLQRFSPANRALHRQKVRDAFRIADEEVVFLFVGNDFVRKGLKTAERAVRRMAKAGEPVRLFVCGQRRLRDRLPKGNDKQDTVLYTGRVADAAPYYAAADAFVLPTYYDPCSLSVGEAAASGLPVVTTRSNGASELITARQEGFIQENAADDRELESLLTPLLDERLRTKMGMAARQLAELYPLDANCDAIEALYHEVYDRRRCISIPFRKPKPVILPAATEENLQRRPA